MRIKFLSFIASFFMVSFVITSCLDDDNNIEYSPDATIHAFSLDTIGYGITYKFTIDQQKGEIYNEDSLPVHADTIIDKILIKTLTTVSGVITMKNKADEDSIININDSIDLRNPIKIKVWSTEALAGISPDQTKEYTIEVRVHKHDPDSLKWNYVGAMQNEIINEQKTIEFNNKFLTYSKVGDHLKVYQNSGFSNWTAAGVNTEGDLNVLPNSILPLNEVILATANNKVYESTDGINWIISTKFSGEVNTFVSKLKIENETKITYIKTEEGKRYFYSIQESQLLNQPIETRIEEVDERFPIDNISYTTFSKGKSNQNIIVGKHHPAIEIDINNKKVPVTIAWGYDGKTWVELGAATAVAYCPAFDNPTIIHYNDLFYIFGDKFDSFYVSINEGVAWKKASKKFSFPNYDWSKSNITESTEEKPEFRGRKKYSVVQDTKEEFIYILFSKEENITFTEEVEKEEEEKDTRATEPKDRGPYRHDSEVWSARLNQLWFDLDPQHAGQ
ncbi:DUF6242 domain-containing protein [Bacteroides acidifaciens]|uniref:Uncharacterized protein n=2 Tax=Bacteroides acidifaciens TaxID=85831 RepID=A0A4S2AYG3_9BACE|nr:DUF6242 domain-containing protein [Bacteroides acidifaciens]TGY06455.1 hypothetical protein E5356_06730 [Bacteroides acidifaciens]